MSLSSGIKLHEALRHAHGLPHHVKVWLASRSTAKTAGVPRFAPRPPAEAAPASGPTPALTTGA